MNHNLYYVFITKTKVVTLKFSLKIDVLKFGLRNHTFCEKRKGTTLVLIKNTS